MKFDRREMVISLESTRSLSKRYNAPNLDGVISRECSPTHTFLTIRLSHDGYPPIIQSHIGMHSLAMALLPREYHLEITLLLTLSRISIHLLYEYYYIKKVETSRLPQYYYEIVLSRSSTTSIRWRPLEVL